MTGAMYSAVSGLKTHMTALNVIGNNISNVNTNAYKATRYTFSEALYTTTRTGSNGSATQGGRNPAQVGYGCSIGTIDLDMSTKTFTPTGIQMDCMIDGDGFFLVSDKSKASGVLTQSELEGMSLTRLGNFEVKDGWVVDGEGQVLYGFMNRLNPEKYNTDGTYVDETDPDLMALDDYTPCTTLSALRVPYCVNYTELLPADGKTADPSDPTSYVGTVSRTRVFYATMDAGGNVADYKTVPAEEDLKSNTNSYIMNYSTLKAEPVSLSNLSIDSAGCITGMTQDDQAVVLGYVAIGKVDSPNGVTHVDGRYYQALGGAGKLHLTSIGGNVAFTPDGTGSDIEVISAGDTELICGGLEGSGTDLATEISNMIVIQRGYQANTRIVTVTDSMLEELVNMKR